MKEQQPSTRRIETYQQKIVYGDTVDLAQERAENRARVARLKDEAMIRGREVPASIEPKKPRGRSVSRRLA